MNRKRLPQKRRRRLQTVLNYDKQLEAEGYDVNALAIPTFLDRQKWTKTDYERSDAVWKSIVDKRLEEQRKTMDRSFQKMKRIKQGKILRERIHQDHKIRRAEKWERKVLRESKQRRYDNLVLEALSKKLDTVGKIQKRTGIEETREVRRSLRRLIKRDLVTKPSSRRYVLVKQRKRRRLSDVLDYE